MLLKLDSEVSKAQAIVWLLQLRDGLEVPGKTELPEDKRRGKQKPIPNPAACVLAEMFGGSCAGKRLFHPTTLLALASIPGRQPLWAKTMALQ